MNYQEVLAKAKEIMAPKCRVCPECNGLACKGEIPGVGGIGNGNAFTSCRDFFKSVKLHMDAVHPEYEIDTTASIMGDTFAAPIFVAPIGGMALNYTGAITETEYLESVVNGALDAGIMAFTGDGPVDTLFPSTLPVLKAAGSKGVPTIKPWAQEKIMGRIADIKELNPPAFAMDIDSAALVNLRLLGKPAYPKSQAEIEEIVKASGIPFIVKGVMTPESAKRCLDAGAYGIVVSTHGGRIMEDTTVPAEMLPAIREAVGDDLKIFVDGGIRTGADVFKCLALGADAVLIGRPFAIAAHGGRAEGVTLYAQKIIKELKDTMLMTNCRTIKDITRDKICVK